ncbi:MAG: hypothetical protein AUJ49_04615 [Desulfovibrionaceae bacterium CG1_02_65_16]|nr:MAG: hypothetical protein AUJ49_04615 [Desulfovibrionaceae bacterium CG1_02_65_16]
MKILLRLWRGEVALWKSFWLLGVLGKIILIGSFALLAGTVPLPFSSFLTLLAVNLLHTIFSIVCIWRSADNYAGPRAYGFLARAFIVFGCVSQFLHLTDGVPGAGG